jgi:hypothetical protein
MMLMKTKNALKERFSGDKVRDGDTNVINPEYQVVQVSSSFIRHATNVHLSGIAGKRAHE